MDETLNAFASPSWWVLTVAVGLLLNILAPFINKGIESFWASQSKKKAEDLSREEAAVQFKVKELASRNTGYLEAKMEMMYWAIRIVLVLSIYLLLIQVVFALPLPYVNIAAAPIAIVGFLNVTKHWKRWRLGCRIHNLLAVQLKQDGDE